MKTLEGQKILVTGGGKGIGKAIVVELVAQGAEVGFTYLSSAQAAQQLVQELQANGGKVRAYAADVSDYAVCEKLIDQFVADFSGIDALVNNAGITQDNLLLRMSEAQFDQVINTNLKSAFNLTKAATKPMIKARKGALVHIASVVGIKGNPGQANYAASKAGLIGFSKSVARELGGRNIRSNVVAPGFIQTDMTDKLGEAVTAEWIKQIPLARMGTAQEVAQVVAFLCSPSASYITSQVLPVCGGII